VIRVEVTTEADVTRMVAAFTTLPVLRDSDYEVFLGDGLNGGIVMRRAWRKDGQRGGTGQTSTVHHAGGPGPASGGGGGGTGEVRSEPARPARLSADLTMSDGRLVHVPVVSPAPPASAGRIAVAIPYPDAAMPGRVISAAVTNEELGVIFRSGFPYTHVQGGDTLTVEFGEESLDAGGIARVFGEWP
jgi:hypothetical protein